MSNQVPLLTERRGRPVRVARFFVDSDEEGVLATPSSNQSWGDDLWHLVAHGGLLLVHVPKGRLRAVRSAIIKAAHRRFMEMRSWTHHGDERDYLYVELLSDP